MTYFFKLSPGQYLAVPSRRGMTVIVESEPDPASRVTAPTLTPRWTDEMDLTPQERRRVERATVAYTRML